MRQSATTTTLLRSKARELNTPCKAQSPWHVQETKRQRTKENHRLLQLDTNLNIQRHLLRMS